MTSVLEALNTALHKAMQTEPSVFVLGEDILDPYGGAFKVTRGLSTAYPDRVITTPISEGGIVGVGAGMALRGLRPVVEIMFGDFLTLTADQLINHAAKFRWMYNDQVRVPLTIRTPMGGRRGYGPTHSQTLEKLFLGVPGLRVLAPNIYTDPGTLLYDTVVKGEDPTLFIENKLMYPQSLLDPSTLPEVEMQLFGSPPWVVMTVKGAPAAHLTLTAYGYMAGIAQQAQTRLAYDEEIFTELVVPTQLAPFELAPLFESVNRTGRLVTVEEGSFSLGWGAEVLARAVESCQHLRAAARVAASEHPIPASPPLEQAALPGVEEVVQAVRGIFQK